MDATMKNVPSGLVLFVVVVLGACSSDETGGGGAHGTGGAGGSTAETTSTSSTTSTTSTTSTSATTTTTTTSSGEGGSGGAPGTGGAPGVGGGGEGGGPAAQCGWSEGDQFYMCWGNGADPTNTFPFACPEGLVEGAQCGNVTGVGCCDAEGNNWYCAEDGNGTFLFREACN
jgi:hypothetical protein